MTLIEEAFAFIPRLEIYSAAQPVLTDSEETRAMNRAYEILKEIHGVEGFRVEFDDGTNLTVTNNASCCTVQFMVYMDKECGIMLAGDRIENLYQSQTCVLAPLSDCRDALVKWLAQELDIKNRSSYYPPEPVKSGDDLPF